MADGGFRGTNIEQDSRFADKQKKLLKSIKFPASYSQKVNMSKVKIEVMKPWIHKRVIEILGVEDELLINFIFEMLEAKKLDPKELQINLTEFLAKETPGFVTQLWGLLLSAQENVAGIPQVFLDEKMREVKKMEEDAARMREELARRQAGSGGVGEDEGGELRAGGREEEQEKTGRRSSRWDDSGREERKDGVDRYSSSRRREDRYDNRRDESGRDDRRDRADRYRDSRSEYSRRESGCRDDYEREERGSRRERDDSRRDSRGDYSRRESDHKHRDYERESRREVDQRSDRRSPPSPRRRTVDG
ncbi:PWI domain-containing protein [Chytriomyces sp. MP71]|nr:PWI domain-containing protein [Chytriomyces sp. MP71]KAI8617869.1 PWI domain-containing protein [Chytriomyces sp. MP71]